MLRLIEKNDSLNIESSLNKCKELDRKIKVLQAEYDRIKKGLIENYFVDNEEFISSEGIVMATYKSQTRNQFMQSELKKDYPDLYKTYSAENIIKVFLLKK